MQQGYVTSFKDLKVWKKAHELTLFIYKVTREFPIEEKFGLTSQMRRSACSIPTNIVEGYKRKGRKELLYFLNIAEGSLEETKYHLILANDLGYYPKQVFQALFDLASEDGKILTGLKRSLLF